MPDSPQEWLQHLSTRLDNRRPRISKFEAYYRGDHPLAFATSEYREEFGRLLEGYADNWCRLIVDAVRERLFVVGFRFGATDDLDEDQPDPDEIADRETWAIWQANRLDSRHQQALATSLVAEESYGLVWPGADSRVEISASGQVRLIPGQRPPRVTFEHPLQAIVEEDPADPDHRLAALKRWVDSDGHANAVVYLPEQLAKFRTEKPVAKGVTTSWTLTEEQVNPLFMVPMVPLENRPDLFGQPTSEIDDVIPNQDAINKLAADMLVASEYGAFVQRLITGVEIPTDPETNQPLEGWDSQALKKRILTVKAPDARGISFQATDLRNFVTALDNRVNSVASQTRTPPHYLNASADRLSGESIKAAESGLVAKAREKQSHYGERFEEIMRLAHLARGDMERATAMDAETLWRDPETRTESEHTDAVIKKLKARLISWQAALEDLNYSPTAIQRMRRQIRQDALEFGLGVDFNDDQDVDVRDLSESA